MYGLLSLLKHGCRDALYHNMPAHEIIDMEMKYQLNLQRDLRNACHRMIGDGKYEELYEFNEFNDNKPNQSTSVSIDDFRAFCKEYPKFIMKTEKTEKTITCKRHAN